MLGVTLVCFALVHLAPGDPLVSVVSPPDASQDMKQQMMVLCTASIVPTTSSSAPWIWPALQGDLGILIASSRPVGAEVSPAVGNTLVLAVLATLVGFFVGSLFGFVAGYFRDSWVDKPASSALGDRRFVCRTIGSAWSW